MLIQLFTANKCSFLSILGQSRFLYIEKLEKKAARVIVPKWNTGLGKVKHELIDILVDLFDDLQKYGHESVAFPMRSFKDWPHGRLTKAIIMGLQTHIEKYRKACRLKVHVKIQ